ncbi:MAG: tetratricopeptide repeat protein [Kordiimonadaceae bacterium]|nr:tetratricopeptide repeat protein [Kordiimonadaceae bacterium]
MKLGNQAIAQGKNDEAMRYFEAVLRRHPENTDALAAIKSINPNSLFRHDLKELNESFKKGEFRQVEMRCKMLLDRFPDVTELYELLAASLASQQNMAEAIPLFIKVANENPFKATAHYNLGNAYKDTAQYDKAIVAYAEAIKYNPNHVGTLFNMSNLYRVIGQLDNALNCLKNLEKIKPNNAHVTLNLAGLYKDKGDFETAIKYFDIFIKMGPGFPGAYHDKALCLLQLDQKEEAQKLIEKSIEIEPRFSDAYINLANIFQEQGNYEEAIDNYKKGINLNPATSMAHNNLGNAYRETGQFNNAVKAFESSLIINPDRLETLHNAANTYGEKSNFPKAIEMFERALGVLPNGPVSLSNLAIMHHIMGNEDKTSEMLGLLTDDLLKSIENEPRKWQYCYVYRNLLNKLYDLNKDIKRKSDDKADKIYVMGPSLTLANRGHTVTKDGKDYISEVKWMAGIKAFHLASNAHAKYKSSVKSHLAEIPKGSEIIFNIGTIDTRVNDGITVAAKKMKKPVVDVAKETAEGYFDFTYAAALEAGLKPIHCGVAAPLTTLDVDGSAEAIEAILEFNRVIKEKSEEKGILYIDVHKITVTKDGIADGSMHIDPYHLIPSAINQAINS